MAKKYSKILIFDLDDTLYDSTNQAPDPDGFLRLKIFEGLLPTLASNKYNNILVTTGDVERQNMKIDMLGIRKYFSDIHIVDTDKGKRTAFKKIVETSSKEAIGKIIVIGNRIDAEIRYGNILGLKTIFVKHGKHKNIVAKDHLEMPSHTIETSDFKNLGSILESIF